jgi:hypothetical protein
MYTNVSMEHNSNIDKRDELHNNSLKNRRTSSKYPNTFIHHNSHVLNNEYMISIYTYSHTTHEAPLLLGRPYYIYIYTLHVHLAPYMPPLGVISYTFNPIYAPLGS